MSRRSRKRHLAKITQSITYALDVVSRYVPAHGKQEVMMGAGAFAADHFVRLIANRKNGIDNPWGITLSCVLVVGIGVAQYVNRFRNMTRPVKVSNKPKRDRNNIPEYLALLDELELPHEPGADQEYDLDDLLGRLSRIDEEKQQIRKTIIGELQKKELCTCLVPYNVKNATFFRPDVHHPAVNSQPLLYLGIQGSCILYMGVITGAGILNAYSLTKLVGTLLGQSVHPECGDEQSPTWLLSMLFVYAMILAYANPRSFHRANLQMLRDYYHTFIHHGYYKNITKKEGLLGLIANVLGTINIFFTNRQMLKLIDNYALCNVGVGNIPFSYTQSVMYTSAFANFVVTGFVNTISIHNKRTRALKKASEASQLVKNPAADIENQLVVAIPKPVVNAENPLDRLPRFKRFNQFILLCLAIDAFGTFLNGFVSTYSLKETINNEDAIMDLSDWRDWSSSNIGNIALDALRISMAVLAALISGYNIYAFNLEGYRYELENSIKDLPDAPTPATNNPTLTQGLLTRSDSTSSLGSVAVSLQGWDDNRSDPGTPNSDPGTPRSDGEDEKRNISYVSQSLFSRNADGNDGDQTPYQVLSGDAVIVNIPTPEQSNNSNASQSPSVLN